MFGNHQSDRVRQLFADQFEIDGEAFLYRKNMKGAPVRVSASERDEFIAAFNHRLRYRLWGIIPGTILLIAVLVIFTPDVRSVTSQIVMYIGLGILLAIFMCAYWWAWTAPFRELERRPTLGAPRSRAETRKVMLARMTYGQLGAGLLAIAALLFEADAKNDLLVGWNRLWLVVAALGVIGIAFQAHRKWRFDSTRPDRL